MPIEIVEYLKWRLKFYENNRLEIQPFLERLGLTVQKAQNGEYESTGSLRSILRKYVILFVSSGKIDKNLIVVKTLIFTTFDGINLPHIALICYFRYVLNNLYENCKLANRAKHKQIKVFLEEKLT